MARIIELFPGKDGVVCTARVKTQNGVLLRPVQRLYPLEITSAAKANTVASNRPEVRPVSPKTEQTEHHEAERSRAVESKPIVEVGVSRHGRLIRKPKRLED